MKKYDNLKSEYDRLVNEREDDKQELLSRHSEIEGLKKNISYQETECANYREEIERLKKQLANSNIFKAKYEE